MIPFPKRPTQRLVFGFVFFLLAWTIAAGVVEFGGGWVLGITTGVAACAGVLWYAGRPPRESRHRVTVDEVALHSTDPDGEQVSIAWADIDEIAVVVEARVDEPASRTWLIHAGDRLVPLAIPQLATGGDELMDRICAFGAIDGGAVWAESPGVQIVWSKEPGWAPPPPAARVITPSDPRMPFGQQWRMLWAAAFPVAASVAVARRLTGSDGVATIVVLAWLVALWFVVRRNHPGIGHRVEIADGRITLHGPRGRRASIATDAVREIAFETRLSFLHGKQRYQILEGADGERLEVASGTAGDEAFIEWTEALPGYDVERFCDAMFGTDDDDPPGVRRIGWTRE